MDTVTESLRSDLSLCRQEQDRLQEALRRQKQEAKEQQEVAEAALQRAAPGAKELVGVARSVAVVRREQQELRHEAVTVLARAR